MKASHARGWKRIRNSGFNVRFGSWVCENVGQAREMPFRLNCRNFNVNEINGLEGENLRASSRFTQKTGKIVFSTQSGSIPVIQRTGFSLLDGLD